MAEEIYNFQIGDIAEINVKVEDMMPEDFGLSGIVLQHPLVEKIGRGNLGIKYHYKFNGTLLENDEFGIFTSMSGLYGRGDELRDYLLHKSYFKLVVDAREARYNRI